jgi:predicted DCC family thiol-disulfide oxidoreductase YuxK
LGPGVHLVYDGLCPFCANYIVFLRAAKAGVKFDLVNARTRPDIVQALAGLGYDVDRGMAVIIDNDLYHGADALHVLALLTGANNGFNRLNYLLLRSPARARALYPFMRLGRTLILRLLGRSSIAADRARLREDD